MQAVQRVAKAGQPRVHHGHRALRIPAQVRLRQLRGSHVAYMSQGSQDTAWALAAYEPPAMCRHVPPKAESLAHRQAQRSLQSSNIPAEDTSAALGCRERLH